MEAIFVGVARNFHGSVTWGDWNGHEVALTGRKRRRVEASWAKAL